MLSTYRYRIYPTSLQKKMLSIHFGHNRFVWNEALRYIKNSSDGKYPGKNFLIKRLPELKKEFSWLKDAHSQTLQATIKRLDLAYQDFFEKIREHPLRKRRFGVF